MTETPQDSQLLFAVLTVQLCLAAPERVLAAAAACVADPGRDIGERLVAEGAISAEQRRMIAAMVAEASRASSAGASGALELLGEAEGGAATFMASLELSTDVHIPAAAPGSDELTQPSEPEVTREQRGRYAMGGEFGRGGQARVLLAMDAHLGREVAWKELLPQRHAGSATATNSTAVTRFLREARITGLLEHPNIVPVHELGRRQDGTLYYTMRIVRGQTLDQRLSACGTLGDRLELLGAFLDMCNAISFAHSKGVIHRDLKPSNVMVGAFGETVVLDWGLAKVAGSEDPRGAEIAQQVQLMQGARASETLAGWAVGTPSYMSPEQADGLIDQIDERSDVWGLGAVLYELLTGRPPYTGNNPYHVVAQVRSEPVPPITSHCAEAPPELVAVAEKALRRHPDQRYQHAEELAAEIRAWMTGHRVEAYAYSSWELLRRFANRHKAVVAASAAVLLAVLVSLVVVALAWRGAEEARAQEHAQRLEAHYTLAQAYGMEADRLLQGRQLMRARIFAAASQLNNPANPTGPFHDPGFGLRRPAADRLLVKANSRLFQAGHRHISALEERIPRADAMMDVAWSSDGRMVATSEFAKGFTVRDVSSGRDLMRVPKRGTVTYAVAFFPDNRRIAVGGKGPAVQIWELGAEAPLITMEHPDLRSTTAVAVSPDGALVASRGGQELDKIAIWDANDGRLLALHATGQEDVTDLAFAVDGRLASCSYSDPVFVLEPRSGRVQISIPVPEDAYVYGVDFSPDGERLLGACTDGTTRIWDSRSGEELAVLESKDDYFYNGRFGPDGTKVATAGAKGSVALWDASTGELLGQTKDHTGGVSAVAFSPDGRHLASAGYDHQLRLWSLAADDGLARHELSTPGYRMELDPSGERMLTCSLEDDLELWDRASGELLWRQAHGFAYLRGAAFAPDGSSVAASGSPTGVEIRSTSDGSLIRRLDGHEGSVWGVAYAPDGRTIASSGSDQTVRLWDANTGEQLMVHEEPEVHVTSVAFSADGSMLAAAGGTDEFWIWSVPEGTLLHTLAGHEDWVHELAWVGDRHELVSGGRDKRAILWDADRGTVIRQFEGHGQAIEFLDVHGPSRQLATMDREGTVLVWHLDLAEPSLWLLRAGGSRDLAFSASGRELTIFEGHDVVGYPLGSTGAADPARSLEQAEQTAGLELVGFELQPAEPGGEAR
jgi:WD40 repeat protein/tRNA A-37 threonylcarbamoyl transferase component Bud32